MTKIAEVYFRLNIRLTEDDRSHFQHYLEQRAATFSGGLFRQAVELETTLQDGSLRGWIKVGGFLYAAVVTYGEFREGIQYLVQDARAFGDLVLSEIHKDGVPDSEILRFERRLGVPGKIKKVLSELDYIKRHRQHLSKEEYDKRIASIERKLRSISRSLDTEEDQKMIAAHVPATALSASPRWIPSKKLPRHNLTEPQAAIRARDGGDIEHSLFLDEPVDVLRSHQKISPERLYRLQKLEHRIKLIPYTSRDPEDAP